MSNLIGIDGKTSMSVQINPLEAPTIKCENCQGVLFDLVFIIKKINKMSIGAPTDQMMPIQIFRCADCGDVLKDSLPHPNLLENE